MELVACSRPEVVGTLAEIGHMLTESKTLWPWLQGEHARLWGAGAVGVGCGLIPNP